MTRITILFSAFLAAAVVLLCPDAIQAQNFSLNASGYYSRDGVDVMAFNDFYPEGHQGGISILMHGHRVASNGDIRFEPTPGQWQPVPKQLSRKVEGERIVTTLCFPDSTRHFTGFNPMIYPDVQLVYTVTLEPSGSGFLLTVDLDRPVPEVMAGRAGFNLEFFPGDLFGKPWIMDGRQGIFPQQPNAPLLTQESYVYKSVGDFHPANTPNTDVKHLIGEGYSPFTADAVIAEPYAVGRSFTVRPDDPYSRLTIRAVTGADLKLYDGRMNHNNGWFVLRSDIPAGVTKKAVQWYIEPNVVPGWTYKPVVQTSQVGYLPGQPKVAIIETDRRDTPLAEATIVRYEADGEHVVKKIPAVVWEGNFLRYKYLKADFTGITEEGLYQVRYGDSASPIFRIASDVYDRGVWQPVIEYFLPVQMCHMKVMEKYRVWHNACHLDDALMAPEGNHIDGYVQPADNGTRFKALEPVPGVNKGGWHDAGDDDVRHTSGNECYILTMALEAFHPEIDATAIDQSRRTVEIHEPDGHNDIVQQIEHGMLHDVSCYLALGRFAKGIITNNLRQYTLLGDASTMSDEVPGNDDDRWIFPDTGDGISHAVNLAASARVLRGYNDTLATHCERIARGVFAKAQAAAAQSGRDRPMNRMQLATELYLTTGEVQYFDFILANWNAVAASASSCAWYMARVEKQMEGQEKYREQCEAFRAALQRYRSQLDRQSAETPYGVPYRPSIWGAGWDIQSFGYRHYFLAKNYPDIFAPDQVLDALHFILGRHPGSNQASFAGGVGAQSVTVGYGLNRADWSYIPGGTVSGTALIRPDFPELLTFPYLWQQVEYVLGGGSSHYMFLVLAARDLAGK
ncbi:MAG: glycoside hydrolase family 9 protein [Bacteroidales bacterium]|nr:glycoside hydrolase family 9 protein [Bacteroidales bacterium]